MPRLAAPITAVCGAAAGIGVWLPWYTWDGGDDPTLYHTYGIDRDFLGRYTLVLAVVGAVAAVVCAVSGAPRSGRRQRVWALSSLWALAGATLLTLIDWIGRSISDWQAEMDGITTPWFDRGIYLTLVAGVVGTVSASVLWADIRRSQSETQSGPTPA